MITPVEAAAALACTVVVLASGTLGSVLGAVMCVAGAWWHDPVLLAVGVVFAVLTRPTDGGGDGRPEHA